MILPDSMAGMRECHRILRPNGILATATWERVPWFAEIREGLATDRSLPSLPDDDAMNTIFSETPEKWTSAEAVQTHFQSVGFLNIQVQKAINKTVLKSVQQFVEMLPHTLGMVVPRVWTPDQVEKYEGPAGAAVVAYMKQKYGEGPISWEWVALIATGRK